MNNFLKDQIKQNSLPSIYKVSLNPIEFLFHDITGIDIDKSIELKKIFFDKQLYCYAQQHATCCLKIVETKNFFHDKTRIHRFFFDNWLHHCMKCFDALLLNYLIENEHNNSAIYSTVGWGCSEGDVYNHFSNIDAKHQKVGSNFKKIWKEVRHEIVHRQIVSTLDSHKNNSRIHGYRVYKNFEKKKYKELITICFKYLKKGLESFYILIS